MVLTKNVYAHSDATNANPSDVVAIDILLEADTTMLKHAEANNRLVTTKTTSTS